MVALCAEESQRFSDLKRRVGLSDAGLAKALRRLASLGLLAHDPNGYIATQEGRRLVRELTVAEEIRKQKLVQRLLVLQQMVRPSEIPAFESLRALFKQKPLTLTKYEALAVAEALEVTADRELDPDEALKLYANAINMVGAAISPARTSCRFVVTLDLNRGFDLVEKRLARELEDECNPDKRKKLEGILKQIRTQRPALLRDVHKRFLRHGFP
jgi:hypothetical protein